MQGHVLPLFESVQPPDPRPRLAIELTRAWARGKISMTQSRDSAGQAAAVAHVAAHELGAAACVIKATRAAAP